jgi:hypothetical protein
MRSGCRIVGIRIAAGLGAAAHTTLECVGDLGGAGAGNEAGYTRFACLAAPQQFASEHQRIISTLPYVGSLRWWLRPKKLARNVKTGKASTLLRQRRVVRLDENLDGLFAGADLDTDGLVAKRGDTRAKITPGAEQPTLPTDPQFEPV